MLLLAAMAALPAQATEVVRLTDAQREAVIVAAANGPEHDPVLTPEPLRRPSLLDRSLYPEFYQDGGAAVRDRKVHGEVTMFAGSGATFGMSGTAVIPVGQTGTAVVSVQQGTSRWGDFQGFGFGYSSGGSALGLNSFGNGYGGWGGGWGNYGGGWGGNWQPIRPMRRR